MTTQQMYKGIAGIIKKYKFKLDMEYYLCMVNDYADYFEREEIKSYADNWTFKQAVKLKKTKFNRQQFLKDCGVK